MNQAKGVETKVDLEWNDDHVIPPKVTPDLEFLFDRMIEATAVRMLSAFTTSLLCQSFSTKRCCHIYIEFNRLR